MLAGAGATVRAFCHELGIYEENQVAQLMECVKTELIRDSHHMMTFTIPEVQARVGHAVRLLVVKMEALFGRESKQADLVRAMGVNWEAEVAAERAKGSVYDETPAAVVNKELGLMRTALMRWVRGYIQGQRCITLDKN